MTHTRGTSNSNDRGSAEQRRQRKNWVFERWGADVDLVTREEWVELINTVFDETDYLNYTKDGEFLWINADGVPDGYVAVRKGLGRRAVRCFRCGTLLVDETLECDRIIPAAQKSKKYPMGGRYTRNNVRPVCGKDNKIIAGEEKRKENAKRKATNARRRAARAATKRQIEKDVELLESMGISAVVVR
jgi:hypothetical protein